MERLELNDTTFIIPIRIDNVTRLENTLVIVDFLLENFETRIEILEASGRDTGLLRKLLPKEVTHYFREDFDIIFHRTKYINQLTELCRTPFISLWDADVIIPVRQIQESMDLLRTRQMDFVTPFQYKALDTSYILRDLYIQTRDMGILETHQGKMKKLYAPNPIGGAFFAHRQAYVDAGMENERFYGWGRQDGDRVNRWKILGYKHTHVAGPLFHLTHERGINSTFHGPNQNDMKFAELQRAAAMSGTELNEEIRSWKKPAVEKTTKYLKNQ